MKSEKVRIYYDVLYKKRFSLFVKRFFDIVVSSLMLIMLSPILLILSIAIKTDSEGPVLFRQIRVTQYGRHFKIYKFRTMVKNAERIGSQITSLNDGRITNVGKILRQYRLDEIPQLINIVQGDMTFVGTRPEVIKYVEKYTDEMMATLLLPAGVTSETSIQYRNEEKLLSDTDNTDQIYVDIVLPEKMKINLKSIEDFNINKDIKTMIRTVLHVLKKDQENVATCTD
ncbi:MAG: sugar transferase [Syntrophomonas sp.]